MNIGLRLREFRERKQFSQIDIVMRTGLSRSYISKVENGFMVPTVESLQKFAHALETPLYVILYEDERQPDAVPVRGWGSHGEPARYLNKLRQVIPRLKPCDRAFILDVAAEVAKRGHHQLGRPVGT